MFGNRIAIRSAAAGLRCQHQSVKKNVSSASCNGRWSPRKESFQVSQVQAMSTQTSCLQIRQPVSKMCGLRFYTNQIVEEGKGTHKPSPFQGKILVWTKTYRSLEEIPQRVTRAQMKKAMDKFRVKVSIYMICLTLVSSAVVAFIGRKQRHDGMSVTREVLERRQRLKQEGSNQSK